MSHTNVTPTSNTNLTKGKRRMLETVASQTRYVCSKPEPAKWTSTERDSQDEWCSNGGCQLKDHQWKDKMQIALAAAVSINSSNVGSLGLCQRLYITPSVVRCSTWQRLAVMHHAPDMMPTKDEVLECCFICILLEHAMHAMSLTLKICNLCLTWATLSNNCLEAPKGLNEGTCRQRQYYPYHHHHKKPSHCWNILYAMLGRKQSLPGGLLLNNIIEYRKITKSVMLQRMYPSSLCSLC